ncbi:MAG: c-type cytochrome [Thermodesulfobacteriota bacterium]
MVRKYNFPGRLSFGRSVAVFPALVFLLSVFVFSAAPAEGAPARENYGFYCAQCHGFEGRGDGPNATESQPVDPRDHTSVYDMRKLTDAEIIEVIKNGGSATSKSTLMPPFVNTLTDKEIRALKVFVRSLCKCEGG